MAMLDRTQRDRFHQDGYLVVPGLLAPDAVARLEADIARVASGQAHLERDRSGFNLEKQEDRSLDPDAPAKRRGMLRKIQGAVFEVPEVRAVLLGEQVVGCVADLMGDAVYYHSSKVFFKAAGGGAAKPWHQDAAYWAQYAPRQITAWIAVHDADAGNGCVWAIPGSHQLGLVPHVERELQVPSSRIDLARAVPVPVARGGLLLFHALVLHMSQRNTSTRDRWAIIGDYDCLPNPCIDADGRRLPGMTAEGVWPLRLPSILPRPSDACVQPVLATAGTRMYPRA